MQLKCNSSANALELHSVDETASHDEVAHKIGCLYIPILF